MTHPDDDRQNSGAIAWTVIMAVFWVIVAVLVAIFR